jgi:hypothetical protein
LGAARRAASLLVVHGICLKNKDRPGLQPTGAISLRNFPFMTVLFLAKVLGAIRHI